MKNYDYKQKQRFLKQQQNKQEVKNQADEIIDLIKFNLDINSEFEQISKEFYDVLEKLRKLSEKI